MPGYPGTKLERHLVHIPGANELCQVHQPDDLIIIEHAEWQTHLNMSVTLAEKQHILMQLDLPESGRHNIFNLIFISPEY